MKRFILIGTDPNYLINFRGSLIQSLQRAHYQVICMISNTQTNTTQQLNEWGASLLTYPVQRNNQNPLADLVTWQSLRQAFSELQPDIILAYTIKPVIWGGLASRVLPNKRFYALITGLGFAFQGKTIKRKLLSKLVTLLYHIALEHAERVIFQNPDNLNEFVQRGIVPASKCALVNGSGVDISHYTSTPLPNNQPVFLAIGRLLGEKGFREYAQAAQIVKDRYPEATFQLLGPEDPSPDGIPLSEVQHWQQSNWLEYLGSTNDVRPYLQNCHIYVLPSYHEGMPRTVLEAMATGRPILTTDVPGCRETVIPNENGHLIPKANAQALAECIIWFIENRDQWQRMGKRSREIAEEKYDVHKINTELMDIMELTFDSE